LRIVESGRAISQAAVTRITDPRPAFCEGWTGLIECRGGWQELPERGISQTASIREVAMLLDSVEYLHKEHEELLHLLERIEKALESGAKQDFSEHCKSITDLRKLNDEFLEIIDHCHGTSVFVDPAYSAFLESNERARIDAEHQEILRAVNNFREELKFATADRTMAMILPGMELIDRLRLHIAYEQGLLDRIAKATARSRSAGSA
jgi:hypothetical protein